MTRIVKGLIMSDEQDLRRFGPLRFIVSFFRAVIAFIKLFFQSIFNPQALVHVGRRPGPGGNGGGGRRPANIHYMKPMENCRTGGS
jgi:hypothetical protein